MGWAWEAWQELLPPGPQGRGRGWRAALKGRVTRGILLLHRHGSSSCSHVATQTQRYRDIQTRTLTKTRGHIQMHTQLERRSQNLTQATLPLSWGEQKASRPFFAPKDILSHTPADSSSPGSEDRGEPSVGVSRRNASHREATLDPRRAPIFLREQFLFRQKQSLHFTPFSPDEAQPSVLFPLSLRGKHSTMKTALKSVHSSVRNYPNRALRGKYCFANLK